MMEKIIARSKLKWYVNPLMALSIVIVVGVVVDLATGADFLSAMLSARRGGHGVGFLIMIPVISAIRLWYMRRVTVFHDRIEVKFPLHKNWNYQIPIKDVLCYCLEQNENETDHETFITDRLYLLSGKKLQMFIAESDCANYEELRAVLENYFGLSLRKGTLSLSGDEMKAVKRGGYIVLEDISNEELQQLKDQRLLQSRRKRQDFSCQSRKGIDLTAWRPILIVTLLIGLLILLIKLSTTVKSGNTTSLPVVDHNTVLPTSTYLIVDSMDVDSLGMAYWHTFHEKDGVKSTVTHWAFFVKGRKDICVTLAVETDDKDSYSEATQRRYCYKALHQRHRYTLFLDEKESSRVLPYIKANMPYKTISDKTSVISMSDGMPLRISRTLFRDGVRLLQDQHQRKEGIKKILQAANEDVDEAYDYIDLLYEHALRENDNKEITAEALNNLSYIHADKGRYDKAIETIDKAIKLDSTEANYYDSKGEHLYRMGDKEGAEAMWQKVISLEPDFAKNNNSNLYRLLYGK